MFRRARRKAIDHTINAVRPLVAIYQNNQGLPPDFWHNEFVLGFFGFMIGFHGTITSGQKLSQTDKGYLLVEAFTALSNMNGQALTREFTRLTMQIPESEPFKRGADNAAICAFHTLGKASAEGIPWIEKATELATVQGKTADYGAISANLFILLFFQPLAAEFEEGGGMQCADSQDRMDQHQDRREA